MVATLERVSKEIKKGNGHYTMNPIDTQGTAQGFFLRVTLDNIYQTAESKDKDSGEVRPSKWKLQVSYAEQTKNGAKRLIHHDISVPTAKVKDYEGKQGKQVEVQCGAMVVNNRLFFYGV